MARRGTQPKELVRLSPIQFSLSVSIVVVLLAAAGFAGYRYGVNQGRRLAASSLEQTGESPDPVSLYAPGQGGVDASVTFYSTLTRSRGGDPEPAAAPRRKVPAPGKDDETAPETPVPPTPRTRDLPAHQDTNHMLQVASYRDRDSAARLLGELTAAGYTGTVVRADLGDRGVWFRVRVGPYGTEAAAGQALERLTQERKLKGFVVR